MPFTVCYNLYDGSWASNCYIVADKNGSCAVIDPSAECEKLLLKLREKRLTLKAILLTHGHFDHMNAADELKKHYSCPVYISKKDECMLDSYEKSLAYFTPHNEFKPTKADVFVGEGDEIEQDGVRFGVMETPGHSAGSVCYIADDCIFAGDTIFAGSIGRSDCYSGDYAVQQKTLFRISQLEGDYRLYCGHGEDTTLTHEKETNPYL